jgi:hypothetical protein
MYRKILIRMVESVLTSWTLVFGNGTVLTTCSRDKETYGILAPWINLDILVYHAGKPRHPMLYDIIEYLCNSLYAHVYVKISYDILTCFRREYILVYTCLLFMTIYDGL